MKGRPLFLLISDNTDNFIVAFAFWQMFNFLCGRANSKNGGCLTVDRFRDNLQPPPPILPHILQKEHAIIQNM